MATVGNLFVNIRGRTKGFERDLGKARKRVQKDFYRNEAMALQQYRTAGGRLSEARAKGASPAVRSRRLEQLQSARVNLEIARNRPARLQQRRELMMRKERLGALSFAAVSAITGLGVASLVGLFRTAVQSAKRGSALTDQFRYLGPKGGQIVQADVLKMQQQMAFSQDPRVSAAKLERARSEVLYQQTEMELGILEDRFLAFLNNTLDFVIRGGSVDPTRTMLEQQMRRDAIAAQTGGYTS